MVRRPENSTAMLSSNDESTRLSSYQQIMEAAGYVIFSASHSGHFTDVSPSVVKLTGYTPEEIIGKHFTELIDPIWKAQVATFYVAQSRQGIDETAFEFPIITKSGHRKWVEQTVILLKDGGRDEVQAIVHDITDRKWAQESQWRLAELIEHSSDFIGMANPEGKIVYLNQAAQEMIGLDNLANARDRSMYDFITGQDRTLFTETVIPTVQERGHWDGEIHYQNFQTGAPIPIQASVFAIHHPQTEEFLAYATISRDITEMKRAEEKLAAERNLLHLLMDNVPDIIYFKDRQSRFTRINRSHAQFFGVSEPDEVLGNTDHSYMSADLAEALFAEEQEMMRTGNPVLNRLEHFVEEGQPERWVVSNKVPLRDSTGQIIGLVGVSRNVTQQRQADAALRASEARYRAIVEDQNEMVARFEPDGTVVFVNEAFCRYFGMSRTQLLNKSFLPALPPDDQMMLIEKMLSLNKDNPVFSLEYQFTMLDGRVCWQQWAGRVILGDDDEVVEFQAVGRDITERRQAEAALVQSERRNRALLQAIPDLMLVVGNDGTIIDLKADIEEDWYTPPHRMIGHNLREVGLPETQVNTLLDHMAQTFEMRAVQSFNYQLDSPDGTIYHNARAVALNSREALVIIRNVTDMKLAEQELSRRVEQLEALRRVDMELADRLNVEYVLSMALDAAMRLSTAEMGVIGLLDENRRIHLARGIGEFDPSFVNAYLQKGQGIISRVMTRLKPELIEDVTDDPDYIEAIAGMHAQMTFPLMSQDHLVGILSLATSKSGHFTEQIFDFLKLLTSRVAVAVDNARLHQKTETQLAELQTLYDQVSKLEQMKTDMIRIASHDLRNPLATISGYMELLRMELEDLSTESMIDHIDSIDQSVRRMMKMVSGILSLERIEETLQEGAEETFDLGERVYNIFHEQIPQAQLKSLKMHLNTLDIEVPVKADPLQIEQAIANLIGNAIKYTPENGDVTVRLTIDGQRACFEVIDTGYGVPEAQQKRLFQPFFRAKTRETQEIEGSGLGLHLVKTIIERYGGEMVFSSVHGEGSTFGFVLPLVKTK
jgi:PAS domain S-box-containing protein